MGLDFGQWQMRNFRADATEDLARYANNPHVLRHLMLWLEREEIPHIIDILSNEKLWTLTDRRPPVGMLIPWPDFTHFQVA